MDKKVKILHLIPRFEIGGAEKMVWHYARLMNTDNFEIAVASCVEDGLFRKEYEKLGVRVWVGSRALMGGRLGVWRALKKFTTEWQPDIVHTHLMASDFFGYLIKKLSGRKIIWISTQHNVEFNTSFLRRLLWRFILPKADAVVAVADKVNNYCLNNFGVQAQKLYTIFNGVDLKNWLNVPSEKLFAGDKLRLATVGRLEEQKGHIYLLRALAQLPDINWSWEIFGNGSLLKLLQSEAEKFGIADKITWHGTVINVSDKLDNIDVVIQPSLWEGLCIVVIEAMASGRCVLATDPAGEELIVQNKTGLLVPPADLDALAEAIKFLYAHPEAGRLIGENARAYAQENFGIEKNIESLIGLYLSFSV
ncbi:MAG: glycosyltransferase family 4 protein [Candidatus Magasanikbacteria bacterium]